MNPLKKTTKGFSLVEVLISIAILAIMAGGLLLKNNSQKKSQEVQLATRTLAAQLRLMQNDALNGKTINGKNICGIEMFFKNESEYEINYYSQCSGFDFLGKPENNEKFNLQKSKLGTVAGNWIKFLAPYGLVKLSLGENNNGVLLESKDSDQQMVVCLGEAGNIEEIKGDDQFCVGAGMCEPNCSGKTCGDDGCGGSCGSCILPQTCSVLGTCCAPNCSGKTCGDDGCGGSCGSCDESQGLECSDTNFVCVTPIDDCKKLKNMPKGVDDVSELVDDIDCGATATDISNWPNGFIPLDSYHGKFYGNGKTINNLYIKQSGENRGLFGAVAAEAEIRDVNLDVHVKMPPSSSRTVGGLAGTNSGTIRKVSVTGSIEGSQLRAGGVVAMNLSGGQIIDSKSTVTMKDLGGGHAGCLVGTNNGTISGSSTNCSIECTMNCGGLVGFNGYDHHAGSIKNSNASGPVIGPTNALGGLVGINYVEGSVDSNSWWSKTGTGRPNACGVGNGTDPLSCTSPQGK